MNLTGQPAFVGRHCGSHTYDVTAEAVAHYAEAVGLTPPPGTDPTCAPSLLFHSECFKFLGEWYLANIFGNLHARQEWELFAPLRVGSSVRSRSTIIGRYSKRGRDYVLNETDLMDAATGQLLVRGRTHQSFLPPRVGDPSTMVVDRDTAKKKQPPAPFPTATGENLASTSRVIDERRCWLFSGPEKNYHNDRESARALGFPDIVVQGMMSTCFVAELMHQRFGDGWVTGGKMDVKLTNVLWVNETVATHGRVREEVPEGTRTRVHCEVWADKPDGTRILLGEASAVQ